MRVAVLGTGTMGLGIARSLMREGIDVTAWNRHIDKAHPLEDDGATVAESAAEAVGEADVVLTMLFDETAVAATAGEFLPAMKDDAVWMQAATVGPEGQKRQAELAAARGIAFVDAPVVGTKKPADEGTLVVLVSGASEAIGGDFETSFAVDGLAKDLGLMIDAAEPTSFSTDLLATLRGLFERTSSKGNGGDDIAAVVTGFDS